MHIKLPQKFEEKVTVWRHRLLPRTLFFRTMLLIFIPLIVVQVVSVVVFFDGSWSRMGRRLSENLVDEMNVLIRLKEEGMPLTEVQKMAAEGFQIDFRFYDASQGEKVKQRLQANPMVIAYLKEAMENAFAEDKWSILVDERQDNSSDLIIFVEKESGVYQFVCAKKKIFSTSIFMFVVWMVATSILLFLVSVLFLRIQVRAIADLAQTAENFGKGIDDDGFKPYGSSEVRKAGYAFVKMKERILRQIMERTQMLAGISHDLRTPIMERTQMLAGISHDLRTPLTRMKLTAAMMENSQDQKDFLADIDEMEKMLNGYLAFVRGEGDEPAICVDVNRLVRGIVSRFASQHIKIKFFAAEKPVEIRAKEQALRRAVTNIVANASRYGKKIEVRVEQGTKEVRIIVDDNGPGIPQDKREAVFRAFYRIENSRNKETGGIGLGLAITKDIITAHGGHIVLEDGPLGGLRVVIKLPA